MTELRMEHQVRQLEGGTSPDDYVDPKGLDALTRRNLREAFRLVASIQKRLDPGGSGRDSVSSPLPPRRAFQAYAETPRPELSTPWREADFCVVDIETTGLDPGADEIISFAALQIERGRLRLNDALYELVRPRRIPDRDTILIHGLRKAELVDAPPLAESLDGLLEALTGRVMVAHVASIEQAFLGAAFAENGISLINPVVDTAALAAELFRLRERGSTAPLGLTPLAQTLGLPVHRPHEADGDALTTAQVFLALATHLDRFSPQTVGSLERLRRSGRMPLRQALLRLPRRLVGLLARP
jgi:DNA polymerase-3 subunit epsilon